MIPRNDFSAEEWLASLPLGKTPSGETTGKVEIRIAKEDEIISLPSCSVLAPRYFTQNIFFLGPNPPEPMGASCEGPSSNFEEKFKLSLSCVLIAIQSETRERGHVVAGPQTLIILSGGRRAHRGKLFLQLAGENGSGHKS